MARVASVGRGKLPPGDTQDFKLSRYRSRLSAGRQKWAPRTTRYTRRTPGRMAGRVVGDLPEAGGPAACAHLPFRPSSLSPSISLVKLLARPGHKIKTLRLHPSIYPCFQTCPLLPCPPTPFDSPAVHIRNHARNVNTKLLTRKFVVCPPTKRNLLCSRVLQVLVPVRVHATASSRRPRTIRSGKCKCRTHRVCTRTHATLPSLKQV